MKKDKNTRNSFLGIQELNRDIRELLKDNTFGSLFVFDIDNFRRINCDKGETTGDRIISLIHQKLQENQYRAYRVGGEEFAIISSSNNFFNEINNLKVDISLYIHEKTGIKITISGGCIHHPGKSFGNSEKIANLLFAAAEQLLIAAKKQGRDRIILFPTEPTRSLTILNAMVRFYKELARINASTDEMEYISITGLPNKNYFQQSLENAITEAQKQGETVTLILLSADSFKEIENSEGALEAYRHIVDISRILKDVTRSTDTIAQEELTKFAIIIRNIDKKKIKSLADRILNAINERTQREVSIGIYSGPPIDAKSILKESREALSQAIDSSTNKIVIH